MFCSSQGDSCPKQLIPLARAIADAPLDDVPQFRCGSAVLAATYRGLCTGVMKASAEEPIFVGCPLLLQLWSYERFPMGRPEMSFESYAEVSPNHDDVDRPMMGSLWCLRRPSWVGVQTGKSYPDFVGHFDALVDADVRWTPYTTADVEARAPSGLSSLCQWDQQYCMMRKPILYDIHVEEYHVNRVLRQFGLYQQTPVPIVHSVAAHVHKWTRQGQPPGSLWADKVRPFVEFWAEALDDMVFEDRPHSDEVFADYLRWYLPRTRTRVVHVQPQPQMVAAVVSETYRLVRDQNFAIAYDVIRAIESEATTSMGHYHDVTPTQHQSTLQRIVDLCGRFRRAVTCRGDNTHLPPRAPGPVLAAVRASEYRQVGGTDDDSEDDDSELARTEWVNSFFDEGWPQDKVGSSQMGEAPPVTQDSTQGEQTPVLVQGRLSTCDTIPPEPLTYSQHQTRAAQAAARRGRRRGKRARI
ncbi:hypothetical protein C2845_PM09G10190 [Panicum miliaceum]|uniref:Aminotransferase-like plant mobile domain-containing protein n=1 Tax=Panicum miliaceum TaxID=4540 RepID=A0A3L6S393_PANMI|nr:hypothetical protein C2845_PM09G10190 [Panicum miliaceum]